MSAPQKKLTILVSSIPAVGHINACAGALQGLVARGHRVIFLLTPMFAGKLSPLGYEEYVVPVENAKTPGVNQPIVNPGELLAKVFVDGKIIGPYPPMEKLMNMFKLFSAPHFVSEFIGRDGVYKRALELYKPDLIYVDGNLMPSLYYSNIPWVRSISPAPLFFYMDKDLPPGGSGLALNSDRTEWEEWEKIRQLCVSAAPFQDKIEKELGYPRFPNDQFPQNYRLAVYACPEEMNYPQIRDSDWFNLEVFTKPDKVTVHEPLEKIIDVADFLKDWKGNLIYVSMGSMGSVDLELMKRLVRVLGVTSHRYIISKGPRSAQYELAPNMWGAPYLPQTRLLPHVDLVITHGGNNTVTEVYAQGKPMIVLPLFGDQFDNAQRLQETGLGARIDPYSFEDSEFTDAIERLLADDVLKERLQVAAKRIQAGNRHQQLAEKIEQLFAST